MPKKDTEERDDAQPASLASARAKREGWIAMDGPAVPIVCDRVIQIEADSDLVVASSVEFAPARPRPELVEEKPLSDGEADALTRVFEGPW